MLLENNIIGPLDNLDFNQLSFQKIEFLFEKLKDYITTEQIMKYYIDNTKHYIECGVLESLFKYNMLRKSDFQILLQIHLERGYISPRIIKIFNEYYFFPGLLY